MSDIVAWLDRGRELIEDLTDALDYDHYECCGTIVKGTHHTGPKRERAPDPERVLLAMNAIKDWAGPYCPEAVYRPSSDRSHGSSPSSGQNGA